MKAIPASFVLLVIAVAGGTSPGAPPTAESRPDTVVQWEYRVLTKAQVMELGMQDLAAGLNRLGDEGWELAAVASNERAVLTRQGPEASAASNRQKGRRSASGHGMRQIILCSWHLALSIARSTPACRRHAEPRAHSTFGHQRRRSHSLGWFPPRPRGGLQRPGDLG